MEVDMEGITVSKRDNGIIFQSKTPLYVLANRDCFDFQYINEFDNHYYNKPDLERFLVKNHGISVISTVEFFEKKFFTNLTIFIDAELDNITLLNIYKTAIETISTVSCQLNAVNKDNLSNKLGNYYNMIYVVCRGKSDKIISFDISLFYEVKELVGNALTKSFNNLGYFNE